MLTCLASPAITKLAPVSNGSRIDTPIERSRPAPSMPASMIPGPAPVTTIQPAAASSCGDRARLLVERILLGGAGRPEDRDLADVLVGGEHGERVAHLGDRRALAILRSSVSGWSVSRPSASERNSSASRRSFDTPSSVSRRATRSSLELARPSLMDHRLYGSRLGHGRGRCGCAVDGCRAGAVASSCVVAGAVDFAGLRSSTRGCPASARRSIRHRRHAAIGQGLGDRHLRHRRQGGARPRHAVLAGRDRVDRRDPRRQGRTGGAYAVTRCRRADRCVGGARCDPARRSASCCRRSPARSPRWRCSGICSVGARARSAAVAPRQRSRRRPASTGAASCRRRPPSGSRSSLAAVLGRAAATVASTSTRSAPAAAAAPSTPQPDDGVAAAAPAVVGAAGATDFGIDGVTPWVVPNSDFYRIDTALAVPQVPKDSWSLRIHGMVDRELELTFADLLRAADDRALHHAVVRVERGRRRPGRQRPVPGRALQGRARRGRRAARGDTGRQPLDRRLELRIADVGDHGRP